MNKDAYLLYNTSCGLNKKQKKIWTQQKKIEIQLIKKKLLLLSI
jgi:hypothetical protein